MKIAGSVLTKCFVVLGMFIKLIRMAQLKKDGSEAEFTYAVSIQKAATSIII